MTNTHNEELARRNRLWRQHYLRLERRLAQVGADRVGAERLRADMSRVGGQMMAANGGLIGQAVVPFASRSDHPEDLRSAAALALWQAFLDWDPDQGALSTWAWQAIKGAVGREVARLEFDGLDYGAFTARQVVAQAAEHIRAQTGQSATNREIAHEAGLSVDRVRRARMPRPVRLDAAVGGAGLDLPDLGAGQGAWPSAAMGTDLPDVAADELDPEQLVVALYSSLAAGGVPAQHNLVIAERLGRGRASITTARTTGAVLLYASLARRWGREFTPASIAEALELDLRTVNDALGVPAASVTDAD